MIESYRVKRRCLIADKWREYGEPVPEAHTWRIVESEVSAGTIERAQLGEQDFAEAVETYCPELAGEIYGLLGLSTYDPDAGDDGNDDADAGDAAAEPAKAKRARKAPVLVKPPEALEG